MREKRERLGVYKYETNYDETWCGNVIYVDKITYEAGDRYMG